MADVLNKLNSANYVTVKVTDNAIVNGNNLLAAYALAKTITPNGASLSTVNRLAVILPPAKYNLGTQSLILDTQYIDIVGSTSDRSKHHIINNIGINNRGTIQQTANDIKLFNLTIENSNTTFSGPEILTNPASYFPDSNLSNTYLENINFIETPNIWSMRIEVIYSGTFINCTGGQSSFGFSSLSDASGIFKDCTGGTYSFGGLAAASGDFINCTGGDFSFGGGGGGNASGDFKDCSGGTYSFGGGGTADGTFENCIGGDYSFGFEGTASGNFKDCSGGDYSFGGGGGGTASGNFTNCIGGIGSFGGDSGTANGNFTNCIGEDYSFGANGGAASGDFKDCTGGEYSFGGTGIANGTFTDCTGGDYSFGGDSGTASGTFTNCTGGIGSFNL
jgi:hypothetical protein